MNYLRLYSKPNILSCIYELRLNVLVNQNLIVKRLINTSPQLYKIKNMREENYKIKDRVHENFSLIYRAPMEYYIAFSKHFTNFTGLCVLAGFALQKLKGLSFIEISSQLSYGELTTTEFEMAMLGIGFFAMNATIQIFISRFPLRVYRDNENNYLAIFEGHLPLTRKVLSFKKGDVDKMPETGILPWNDSRYKILNSRVLLIMNNFRTPSELHSMLSKRDL